MERLRARWLLALAVTVAGVGLGVAGAYAYTRTQPDVYRARVALIAQSGSQPVTGAVLGTIRGLVETDIVAQNVIRNQHLSLTSEQLFRRLHVSTAGSVLTVDVDDRSQDEAVHVAQELSLVFTQLVRDRFGSGAGAAQVTIFDPAHAVGKVSPQVGRDVGWGALFGALLGLLAANVFVLRGRRGVWMPPYPAAEVPSLLGAPAYALPAAPSPPPVLGQEPEEIAANLIERAQDEPFQTVLVAGDEAGTVTAAVAENLARRGELTMWMRAEDANPREVEELTARCAYVLVASPTFDAELARRVDAVVAVTNGDAPHWPGVRLVGTIAR